MNSKRKREREYARGKDVDVAENGRPKKNEYTEIVGNVDTYVLLRPTTRPQRLQTDEPAEARTHACVIKFLSGNCYIHSWASTCAHTHTQAFRIPSSVIAEKSVLSLVLMV